MSPSELKKIIADHQKWLRGDGGAGAYLTRAYLAGAYLTGANLTRAYLAGADLAGANLAGANLAGADLTDANLTDANLAGAYLTGANLTRANLARANLARANLAGADLTDAKGLYREQTTGLYLLKDQPGKLIAYKLVTEEGTGPVYPSITYQIGKTYKEPKADTDETVHCAEGLNVATMGWCLQHRAGTQRILKVEFDAKDIAAIPYGTDGKFRVKKLKVLEEVDISKIKKVGE